MHIRIEQPELLKKLKRDHKILQLLSNEKNAAISLRDSKPGTFLTFVIIVFYVVFTKRLQIYHFQYILKKQIRKKEKKRIYKHTHNKWKQAQAQINKRRESQIVIIVN